MDTSKEALHILESNIGKPNLIFKHVDSPQALDELFRLRYKVYCTQADLLRAEDYPEGLESDKYDPYSIHFSASDSLGVVGTIRLIIDSPYGFPIESHCRGKLSIDLNAIPRKEIAEVSRYAIDRRGKYSDGVFPGPKDSAKYVKTIALGIYREMYLESKQRGITHWIALMEKCLYLLLRRYGFEFTPIGEEVNVSGIVAPYMVKLEDLERMYLKKASHQINGEYNG